MSTALKSGVAYENKTREYYAADAGIEDGIWQIKYDRLTVLAGDPDFAYDFDATCSYDIEDPINGFTTNVTIDNFWIPTADNPYATPAEAKAIIERDITDNETNRLVVTDTAMDDISFRIKIDFYPANGVTDNLSVSSIGIWLPHGFTYNGNCNLAAFDGTHDKYTESVTSRPGGQAFVWDFSLDPLEFPDLPPEEGAELETITRQNNIDLIYLLAPTSTDDRIKTVAARSRGFIYLVSLTGVTGARKTLSPELQSFVKRVREKAGQPLCIGFGISTPEQAARAASYADGVIIGSRLVELIEEDAGLTTLKVFVTGLRQALDSLKNTGRY
jgi:hypothetical protein